MLFLFEGCLDRSNSSLLPPHRPVSVLLGLKFRGILLVEVSAKRVDVMDVEDQFDKKSVDATAAPKHRFLLLFLHRPWILFTHFQFDE
jgi:hypothetical protein